MTSSVEESLRAELMADNKLINELMAENATLKQERDAFLEKWEAAADASLRRQGVIISMTAERDRLEAENATLKQERDELGQTNYVQNAAMKEQDAKIEYLEKQSSELMLERDLALRDGDNLRAERDRLRQALQPFKLAADAYDNDPTIGPALFRSISVADLRRVTFALSPSETEEGG